MIDEGIVDKPSDLDVATVMSMGFPPYRSAAHPKFAYFVLLIFAPHVIC